MSPPTAPARLRRPGSPASSVPRSVPLVESMAIPRPAGPGLPPRMPGNASRHLNPVPKNGVPPPMPDPALPERLTTICTPVPLPPRTRPRAGLSRPPPYAQHRSNRSKRPGMVDDLVEGRASGFTYSPLRSPECPSHLAAKVALRASGADAALVFCSGDGRRVGPLDSRLTRRGPTTFPSPKVSTAPELSSSIGQGSWPVPGGVESSLSMRSRPRDLLRGLPDLPNSSGLR